MPPPFFSPYGYGYASLPSVAHIHYISTLVSKWSLLLLYESQIVNDFCLLCVLQEGSQVQDASALQPLLLSP